MKKQVIMYVDVPDDAPDGLAEVIETDIADSLPDSVYVETLGEDDDDNDEVEVALDWGGVTVRDA